jgi:hypothetical protein
MALYCHRSYGEAAAALSRNFVSPDIWELMYLAASLAQANRLDEARVQVERYAAQEPTRSMLEHAKYEPYRDTAGLEHLLDGIRKAGVME